MKTVPHTSVRTLEPPRAAAIAGLIFSVLMLTGLGLVRVAVPADPANPGTWLSSPGRVNAVRFALTLVPLAGMAFLWFMGVLRNRIGALEDKFFATVFLGSGLLFVACLVGSAAMARALIETVAAGSYNSEAYYFGRRVADAFLNVFGIKMAAAFMFSTCTIALRTGILARWVAYSGFAGGLVLLIVIANWAWIALLFPLWVMLAGAQILLAELRHSNGATNCNPQGPGADTKPPLVPARHPG